MTYNDWARTIWPGLTDDEAHAVLWNCTCFPFGAVKDVETHLRQAYEKSGGDVQLAISQAHEQAEAEMKAAWQKQTGEAL